MSENLQSSPTLVSNNAAKEDESKIAAMLAAEAADDRKSGYILFLDVAEVSYLADYFVIVTGFSKAQVRAIAQSIQEKLETQLQRVPRQIEGQAEGSWVLLDYGDVIVHIFLNQEREFYSLEAFWGHAETIKYPLAS